MNHRNSPSREAWFGCEHDRVSREGDERRFSGGYGISGGGLVPSQGEERGWLLARHPFDADVARWRFQHLRRLDDDSTPRPRQSRRVLGDLAQWRQMRYVAQTAIQDLPR